MKKMLPVLMVLALLALVALNAAAQDDMMMTPSVTVSEQVVLDGTVTIDSAVAAEPGFIVIHADNGEGGPGPVIGNRLLAVGENSNVSVAIDASAATPTLFAMLHVDTGEAGVYEFGTVEGADGPVIVDGAPVTPAFNVAVINAYDQFVDTTYTAASVTVDGPGWLVIHAAADGGPGPVLGATQIAAGINADVAVELAGDVTANLWPMLHVDTGEAGVYEFGTVEGADGPVVLGGAVATTAISTAPGIRIDPQIVLHGDGMDDMMMAPSVTAKSVLSEGPGWLVIHAEADGGPGPVLGFAQLEDGLNTDVTVDLEGDITPVLWPMLHVDTGEAGVYEFGTVEGADGPVRVNEAVVTFAIDAAPSISYDDVSVNAAVITVGEALIGDAGWLVIHADNGEGGPGAVIGQALLTPGLNKDVAITVDEMGLTETVFPMLHVDSGEAGVYEFDTVEGADAPIAVNGSVVVGPATPTMMMSQ